MYLAHSVNNFNIKNIFLLLTAVSFLIFMALTIKNYPGHISVYIIFTLVSHGLLFLGFYKNPIFFDAFIGIFLWLGFWFKFSYVVAFNDGVFPLSIGGFNGSGADFDHSLLITSVGISALILATVIRRIFFFKYPSKNP